MPIRPFQFASAVIFGLGLMAAACGGTAASPPRPAATEVRVTTATIGEHAESILTNNNGLTLYLFAPEKDGRVVTTTAVLRRFPALLLPPGRSLVGSVPALPGELGVVTRPDGTRQVTYNEWPLYTFVGDKKAGDITGEVLGNKWFVVQSMMPADGDSDSDGTPVSISPTSSPVASPAPPLPRPSPTTGFNDRDGDNGGSPSDGDGNG